MAIRPPTAVRDPLAGAGVLVTFPGSTPARWRMWGAAKASHHWKSPGGWEAAARGRRSAWNGPSGHREGSRRRPSEPTEPWVWCSETRPLSPQNRGRSWGGGTDWQGIQLCSGPETVPCGCFIIPGELIGGGALQPRGLGHEQLGDAFLSTPQSLNLKLGE